MISESSVLFSAMRSSCAWIENENSRVPSFFTGRSMDFSPISPSGGSVTSSVFSSVPFSRTYKVGLASGKAMAAEGHVHDRCRFLQHFARRAKS